MTKGLQQCSAMQQVVRLLGDLGERYGAEHTFYDLRSPAEAIKVLCINYPKLQEELIHAHENGVGYRVIQAGADLGYNDLQLPLGSNDLILTPIISGSGDSTGQILAGVGLVAAAIFLGPAGGGFLGLGAGFFSGATAAAISTGVGAIGTSLILGGVSQMLSPQPTVPTVSGQARLASPESSATDGPQSVLRGANGRQSYAFTGPANTVGVGNTIPVVYGTALIGSQLLSARVVIEDESDPLSKYIRKPGPNTVLIGGEKLSDLTYANGNRYRSWQPNWLRSKPDNGKTLDPIAGRTKRLENRNYHTGQRAENYMIFFELDRGLFDYVSNEKSTLVDGYITYEVQLEVEHDGPDSIVAVVQTTIQGLILDGQPFRWMQYFSYPEIDSDLNPSVLVTRVKIIDARCNKFCRLVPKYNGIELFKNKSWWDAPLEA
jgi:predicted phage tail protein